MAKVLIVSKEGMASVKNVWEELKKTFENAGHSVDVMMFDKPKRNMDIYDLLIYWTPFTPYFLNRIQLWTVRSVCKLHVFYTVIEGVHNHVRRYYSILNRQYIITPSEFSKRCIEQMGCKVSEVIPHQISRLIVDEEYSRKWRERFPKNKKILLYVGGSINRKGLPKLREAIDILSKKRNDFVMVFHMDDVDWPFCTKVSEVEGANTVVEPEFGKLDLPKVYGKMKASDVIVHPALGEGFGLPVAEALALGKRLVCVNAPAVNEIANPSNSWMVTKVIPIDLRWADNVVFKCVDYDPIDLAEQIDLCLDASYDEVLEKRSKGFEAVSRLHDSYKAFLKFVEYV